MIKAKFSAKKGQILFKCNKFFFALIILLIQSHIWTLKFMIFCQILDEINEHGIRIYQLPDADSDEDEEFKEQTRVLKVRGQSVWVHYQHCLTSRRLWLKLKECVCVQASIPFAVIGSNQLIEVKGKKIRGRLYPWGVVEVENPEHNDFLKLRTMLVWVHTHTHTHTHVEVS